MLTMFVGEIPLNQTFSGQKMGILVAEACDRAFPPMLSETLRERLDSDGFGQQMVEELVEGR